MRKFLLLGILVQQFSNTIYASGNYCIRKIVCRQTWETREHKGLFNRRKYTIPHGYEFKMSVKSDEGIIKIISHSFYGKAEVKGLILDSTLETEHEKALKLAEQRCYDMKDDYELRMDYCPSS